MTARARGLLDFIEALHKNSQAVINLGDDLAHDFAVLATKGSLVSVSLLDLARVLTMVPIAMYRAAGSPYGGTLSGLHRYLRRKGIYGSQLSKRRLRRNLQQFDLIDAHDRLRP